MSGERYPSARGDSELAVLTPYLVPASLRGKKVVNLGDGFILRAIERLLGRFAAGRTLSSRAAPDAAAHAQLAAAPAVVLAGANQLSDRFAPWPGLTGDVVRASGLRLIPFGIGIHGDPGQNDGLTAAAKDVLLALHERIECSSWRCPRTVAWLAQQLPQLAPKLRMTGCPVAYDAPLLDGAPFGTHERRVAVTVTERGDFHARETAVLDFVARRYARAERVLVLHQNFSPPSRRELWRHRWWPQRPERLDPYQRLRQHAVQRGFTVATPADADACAAIYDGVDLHVGSRLHAHLLCLSRARRSWLVRVDGRSDGIAEWLQFPLCTPERLEAEQGCDFEVVRARARQSFAAMRAFVQTLPGARAHA